MTLPATAFQTLPELVRPILSNGMLVGILAALIMEIRIKKQTQCSEKSEWYSLRKKLHL